MTEAEDEPRVFRLKQIRVMCKQRSPEEDLWPCRGPGLQHKEVSALGAGGSQAERGSTGLKASRAEGKDSSRVQGAAGRLAREKM